MKQDVFNPLTWNKEQAKDFFVGILLTVFAMGMYFIISFIN